MPAEDLPQDQEPATPEVVVEDDDPLPNVDVHVHVEDEPEEEEEEEEEEEVLLLEEVNNADEVPATVTKVSTSSLLR